MTLQELKIQVDNLLSERPELANADILVDTEARRFNVHMVQVDNIYAEDPEAFEVMDRKWVTIGINYDLTEL